MSARSAPAGIEEPAIEIHAPFPGEKEGAPTISITPLMKRAFHYSSHL